jgi:N-terminal domain on NACHT_NTPase and P-loop NTPases/NB-ARC domain
MAEAAAIIGLVSSIASLVELSAKVVSRLHEFTSKISEVPESFRSLSVRLPLLTATLQRIQTQAEASRLSDDVTKALKDVVDNTSEQVSVVQVSLSKILPPDGTSKFERALKALKSLAKEDQVQQALEKIHKNSDILVLHQTTRHVDTGDRILEELSKLSVAPPTSAKSFGVCLGPAPQITPDAFVGRTDELQLLQDWLLSKTHPSRQRIVSIVGMGGMGKTQLSLAHVRDCGDQYSSVFWMNAKDETSLIQSIAQLSAVVFHDAPTAATRSTDDEKLKVESVRRWLSEPGNDQWLVIFDNYDDPRLPGMHSPTGYDIRKYFPQRAQGLILITTRSPRLSFAKQLRLGKLKDMEQSLAVLAAWTGRVLDKGKTESRDG